MGVRVAAAAALLGLAACGGSGGDAPSDPAIRAAVAERLAAVAAIEAANEGLAPTPDAIVPTSGTATYDGFTTVRVGGADDGAVAVGATTISASFRTGAVEGRATDFVGTMRGEATAFDGRLDIVDGRVGTERPNDVDATMTGTLRGGGASIDVDAELEGAFLGPRGQGLSLDAGDAAGTIDGAPAPASVSVAAGFTVFTDAVGPPPVPPGGEIGPGEGGPGSFAPR